MRSEWLGSAIEKIPYCIRLLQDQVVGELVDTKALERDETWIVIGPALVIRMHRRALQVWTPRAPYLMIDLA
jgi:hypothetical protein